MTHFNYTDGKHEFVCPKCGKDTTSLVLIDLLITYEQCDCGDTGSVQPYKHMVEAKWHRKCYNNIILKGQEGR